MAEGLADPVQRAAALRQRVCGLGAARDEDGVEHRRSHALEVVVRLDAVAGRLVGAGGEDLGPAGRDDEGEGAGCLERGLDAGEGRLVEAVGHNDGDPSCGDGRFERRVLGLTKALGFLAVVRPRRLFRLGAPYELSYLLGKAEIDIGETLGHALVDYRVLTVV